MNGFDALIKFFSPCLEKGFHVNGGNYTGTISGIDQQEHSAHREPVSVESDDCREGKHVFLKGTL